MAEGSESQRREGEFHDAIVYEGDFRAAIAILAMHERRVDGLLPGLRREVNPASVIQAFVLALLDVGTDPSSEDEQTATRIRERVVQTCAIPPDFRELGAYAEAFGKLLDQVPKTERLALNGPVWVSQETFEGAQTDALAKHEGLDVLADRRSTLLIKT